MSAVQQYVLYLLILVALAVPLGLYIGKIMNGERVFLSRILAPCEKGIYRLLRVDPQEDMGWKQYAASALTFSGVSLVVLTAVLLCQGFLPGNPNGVAGNSWHLAFNTAVSFVTNTNWQSYSAEGTLSYLSQSLGLTVQNFLSAAVGMAVLFAFVRGLTRVRAKGIGNFWADVTRVTLYILIPICLIASLVLVSQGVIQTVRPYETVNLLEPVILADGTEVTQQILPLGPAASQIAIKQLGTNGGGFQGSNSAHPFENPNALTNLVEMMFLLLIPVSLCFAFGHAVKDKRQGVALFLAMFLLLAVSLGVVGWSEQRATPQLAQGGAVDVVSTDGQSGGNMEGKETRFGIATSSTWATFTTAASNGSVNAAHDSFTPLGGMVPMLQMQLGEVIFGGAGCGLYGLLGFAILTVFIAGLMVGRTPEYLGKKIEPREMRMAVLVCLATPTAILMGSAIATLLPSTIGLLNNSGPHGFSEVMYNYASAGGNNGSSFAGMNCNTPFINVSLGFVMLFSRFVQMTAALAIAGSLAQKKKVAQSAGTLSTCNPMFIFLLIVIILLVGALSFFPALALGPIAEHLQMLGLG